MAIIDGIKQIKQFATRPNGDKQLISNWTSTSTVYDWDPVEEKWVAVHDTLASDDKVAQIVTSNYVNNNYNILFSESADNQDHVEGTRKTSKLYYNPVFGGICVGTQIDASRPIENGYLTYVTDQGLGNFYENNSSKLLEICNGDISFNGLPEDGCDTWDGIHTSLKDTVANVNKYCLKVFFGNVGDGSTATKSISYSDLQTLFNDSAFNMENYYFSSATVAIANEDGTGELLRYYNSDCVSVAALGTVSQTGITIQFNKSPLGGVISAWHDFNVYLIFEKMPTVYPYVELV